VAVDEKQQTGLGPGSAADDAAVPGAATMSAAESAAEQVAAVADSAFLGVYLVKGSDSDGPWFYVGKGDHARADVSRRTRGGTSFSMLAVNLDTAAALQTEAALINGLREAGVRLVNDVSGHGAALLTPYGSLAAALGRPDARTLSLTELGIGLAVSTSFAWGNPATTVNIAREVRQAWPVDAACAAKIRTLADAGTPVRLMAVAARSGPVIGAFLITGLRKITSGDNAGRWEFDLATDLVAKDLVGHRLPFPPNSAVRYFAPSAASRSAFLAH
jgi:hypothetical protein